MPGVTAAADFACPPGLDRLGAVRIRRMGGAEIPAGWYPNPWNDAEELYWSGAEWTGISRAAHRPQPAVAPPAVDAIEDSTIMRPARRSARSMEAPLMPVPLVAQAQDPLAPAPLSSDLESSHPARPYDEPQVVPSPASPHGSGARQDVARIAAPNTGVDGPSAEADTPPAPAAATLAGSSSGGYAAPAYLAYGRPAESSPVSPPPTGYEHAHPALAGGPGVPRPGSAQPGHPQLDSAQPGHPQPDSAQPDPAQPGSVQPTEFFDAYPEPTYVQPTASAYAAPASSAPLPFPFPGDATWHPEEAHPDAADATTIRWSLSAAAPAPPQGNPRARFGLVAMIVGIVAAVFAVVPGLSLAAWIPAFGAIALGIVGYLGGRPRGFALSGIIVGGAALAVATAVSIWFLTQLGPFAR
jgi:hypothetical protein